MKERIRLLALALCLALCLTACGGGGTPAETVPQTTAAPETTQPGIDALGVYAAAREAVETARDKVLRVTREKQVTVGGETFQETSAQELTILGWGTEAQQSLLREVLSFGDAYQATFEEICAEGTVSVLVNDTDRLCGPMEADYWDTLTPAALLDEALYAQVEGEQGSGGITLSFTGAAAGEAWALPEGAELLEASGTALVNEAGVLEQSAYEVCYVYGSTRVEESVQVSVTLEAGEIVLPSREEYTQLTDIQAVRLSELACGYLSQAKKVSSALTEVTTAQAAGAVMTQTTTVEYYDEEALMAQVDNSVTIADGYSGQTSTYTQRETMKNGMYTYSEDGGPAQTDPAVTPVTVQQYCEGMFLGNLVALEYWEDARVELLGDLYYVQCTFSEEMARLLRENISVSLYNDPAYMDGYTQSAETTAIQGYFSLDRYTLLPAAAGYGYVSADVVEGQTFAVALQSDQSFHSPDLGVYKALTGSLEAEEKPEQSATPLLYRVTGENGKTLYLMGTIHIGDERTAYLPQSVYDAFDASDVLAVELDIQAFEEAMATDPQVQAQVMSSYCYLDGTTIVDHADLELLEEAEKFMKATGNYNANLILMKPAIWANTLENFFLRQGYDLMTEKGMDNRLLTMAKEQGKPIWSIESGEAQMAMLGGWSDGLQELLLESALGYGPGQYWQEAAELYEQWCLGDEEALRTLLNDDSGLADMTEEEKKLYEEYTKAMIHDRNEAMLETALEYLEGDQTVFYAVGLAHLLQDNGLADGLQAAGCTVEVIEP